MFEFSANYKKNIKINIMLNALMEYNTDNIKEVVAFFHNNFGIWCTADKRNGYYVSAIHVSKDKVIENIVTKVYFVNEHDTLVLGVKIMLAYIYYLCAFNTNDAYKIVNNLSFYIKAIESIKIADDTLNARIKDRFDDYHLNKIDCDFPALVESLNL